MKQIHKDINLSDVWSFPEENASRQGKFAQKSKSANDRLAVALFGGFSAAQGTVGVHKASSDEVKRAFSAMTQRYKFLKKSVEGFTVILDGEKVTVGASDQLRVFEDTYVSNGKIKPIKYIIDWAYRRFQESFRTNGLRLVKGLSRLTTCPATITDWPTGPEGDKARIIANITENGQQTEGMLKPSQADVMASALGMFERMCKQTDLRRTFNDGTGQKLWYLLKLDKKFPKLKIVDDFINAVEDSLVKKYSPYSTTKLNTALKEYCEEEVVKFLKNPKDGTNVAKMASKDVIIALTQHGCIQVRRVAQAIIDNNTGALNALNEFKTELNAADEAILSGKSISFIGNSDPELKPDPKPKVKK